MAEDVIDIYMKELLTVAGGAPVENLRKVVESVITGHEEGAEGFVILLKRMRLAAEAAEQTAVETYSALRHKRS